MARVKAAYIEFDDELLDDVKLSAKVKKLATEGIELDTEIKRLKKRIDAIKNEIKEECGEDLKYTLVVPGVGTVPVVPKEEVVVADADRLAAIFGNNFANFVKSTLSFKALQPLNDLVYEKDAPTHSMVMEAVTIKNTCALSFKAEKN